MRRDHVRTRRLRPGLGARAAAELRAELALSLLFITHDLGVVASVADDVLVLEGGRVRETGPTEHVLSTPKDEYTRRLLDAAPRLPARPELA